MPSISTRSKMLLLALLLLGDLSIWVYGTASSTSPSGSGSRARAGGRSADDGEVGGPRHGEYMFMDYWKDGYHRPPVSTNPRPGPINNVKKPSPALKP